MRALPEAIDADAPAVLGDGHVLIVGRAVALYDPRADTWETATRPCPAAPPADGSVQVVALWNAFIPDALEAIAGEPFAVTVTNCDDAIHNWHLVDVRGADGRELKTPLLEYEQSATLTFTIDAPGQYRFQDDVHPAEQHGTLTVR